MRRTAEVLVAVILAAACTGGRGSVSKSPASSGPSFARGGTLRVAIATDPSLPDTYDPQKAYNFATWEILRCCLLRTLLSYRGRPTDEGGTEVRPDLAVSMPVVSSDGLTWRFDLKPGIHYGPPFQHTEVTAQDIVRALEREADPKITPSSASYAFYYSVIRGFDDYRSGRAATISGLQAPDDHTLVVSLTEPTSDLGFRMALPAAAPIPPGAAEGRADYGRFLVSTGPYMFEGSEELDFSQPAPEQAPVSGYVPAQVANGLFTAGSVTLVRNPSWSRSSDPLRAAYVGRIEISLGGYDTKDFSAAAFTTGEEALFDQVVTGGLDMVFDTSPPSAQLHGFRSDPSTVVLIHDNEISSPEYISMNLAVPPLDDIHVRKAMNLAIDKGRLRQKWFQGVSGQDIPEATGGGVLPTHLAPNALEGGLLAAYRPPWLTSATGGDLAAAKSEMRRSKYDSNKDGICDASVCRAVRLVETSVWPRTFDAPVVGDLGKIGIEVQIKRYPGFSLYSKDGPLNPASRSAMQANGFFNDFPNGSGFFPNLLYGPNLRSTSWIARNDFSMMGATPGELRRWGYTVKKVPTVDGRIERCVAEAATEQEACWASLDQLLMENVVPWIPFLFESATRVVSPRVAHYSFDQFTGMPALDQIALTPAAIAASS